AAPQWLAALRSRSGSDLRRRHRRKIRSGDAEDRHPPGHAVERSRPRLIAPDPMPPLRAAMVGVAVMAAAPASAAELNVLAAGAVRGIIAGMIDDYSRQNGLKINLIVGPTGMLRDAIASGKPADLLIVAAPLMTDIEKSGAIVPQSRVDL